VHSRCSPRVAVHHSHLRRHLTGARHRAGLRPGATGFIGSRPPARLLRRGIRWWPDADARRMPQVELLRPDRLQCEGDPSLSGPGRSASRAVTRWSRSPASRSPAPVVTDAVKERAERSRVGGLSRIARGDRPGYRRDSGPRPRLCSAIGYYGSRGQSSRGRPARRGLPRQVCVHWEAEATGGGARRARVHLTHGVVLGRGRGALAKWCRPSALRRRSIGSGRQVLS